MDVRQFFIYRRIASMDFSDIFIVSWRLSSRFFHIFQVRPPLPIIRASRKLRFEALRIKGAHFLFWRREVKYKLWRSRPFRSLQESVESSLALKRDATGYLPRPSPIAKGAVDQEVTCISWPSGATDEGCVISGWNQRHHSTLSLLRASQPLLEISGSLARARAWRMGAAESVRTTLHYSVS